MDIMEITDIIAIIVVSISLCALICLLFIVCLKVVNEEKREKIARTKLYHQLATYFAYINERIRHNDDKMK